MNTAQKDWDWSEISANFITLPLLAPEHRADTLAATYTTLRAHWQSMTDEMKALEEENNRIFIDAYGLQDELTPEVPIEEITLTCNPAYRYGINVSEDEREKRLRADTVRELISYAVGCMFGRYSLDEPGLILANQGENRDDYLKRIPDPSFMPDERNVLPILSDDWFEDDIYDRLRVFLEVTFGKDNLPKTMTFMRDALDKEVRKYLIRDFYDDHVKRYKKRPIYWQVSSPNGAFQALIYMHRYTPDTLNIVLNDYVRILRHRMQSRIDTLEERQRNPDTSRGDKTRASNDVDHLTAQIAEIDAWERDVLYPLAVQRIPIDLDDGVKANYPKFSGVLKPVKGLG